MTHADTAEPFTGEEYLTVAEIASRIRLSPMTIYRLIHTGALPGTLRLGRSFRVPAAAVRAYLDRSVIR